MARKLIAITHVSLDGVMQAPGGPEEDPSNGFTHGGWSTHFRHEVGSKIILEIIAGEFDLLLGRRTYDIFAGYWPHNGDSPIGKAFNRATKYVVTHRTEGLGWNKSQRIGGDVVEELRRLKASAGPELHVWGSGNLLQTLIGADLVDEFRVCIFPVVLGKGKRLFETGVPPRSLSLIATQSTPKGVLFLILIGLPVLFRRLSEQAGLAKAGLVRMLQFNAIDCVTGEYIRYASVDSAP